MHPALSLRDFSGMLKIIAGAFAIPVIFNTRAKIKAALFYSATAIACVLGYDLIRLTVFLGPNLLLQAHVSEPFIFNHSNVASMMAGASALVLFYFFWQWRRQPRPALACLGGMLIGLAYMVILASRGPQIAFALTCMGAVCLIPGRGVKLLGFLIILLAGLALFVNIEHVNSRFLEKKSMTNFSERITVWTHTWDLAQQRPWLGYGYGKRNFVAIYYANQPPESPFHYPHPHQFWLKLLFEFGWPGLVLHFLAWIILAVGLWRCIFAQPTFTDRLLPGTVGLILCFIHLYALGDYPDNIVLMAQFWLIPVALVLMKKTDNEYAT
jgi:O-antigen ligase